MRLEYVRVQRFGRIPSASAIISESVAPTPKPVMPIRSAMDCPCQSDEGKAGSRMERLKQQILNTEKDDA
jgi:hypothetical protein